MELSAFHYIHQSYVISEQNFVTIKTNECKMSIKVKRRISVVFKNHFLFALWLLAIFGPFKLYAQETSQQWRIALLPSKVTGDPLDNQRFFNAVAVSVQYNRSLVSNIDGVIGLSFLQTIEINGRQNLDSLDQALDRFHKSFMNLDLGLDLIPILLPSSDIRLGLGTGLRRRMEVRSNFAIDSGYGVLVKNKFRKSWDFGGFTYLEYSQKIYQSWFLALRGHLRTYRKGDSIFSVGLSLGQKF